MQTSHVIPLHSDGYLEVSHFFNTARPPFNLNDIQEFNAIYRRVYPTLGVVEKRKAEEFVDHLVKHVEKPEWARKVYGVV